MKIKIPHKLTYFLQTLLLFVPTLAFAVTGGATGGGNTGGSTGSGVTGGSTGGGATSVTLVNPLENTSLLSLLQSILDVIMVFAVPIIVFFIIYAGFIFVTARGEEAKITQAKHALMYAIIGGLIILGAQIILLVITTTVESF